LSLLASIHRRLGSLELGFRWLCGSSGCRGCPPRNKQSSFDLFIGLVVQPSLFVELVYFFPFLAFLLHKKVCDTDKASGSTRGYVSCGIIIPLALLVRILGSAFARFFGSRPIVLLDFHHHFKALRFDMTRKQPLDIIVEFQLFSAHDALLDVVVSLSGLVPVRLFSAFG
jgi:hypothetical protein